jgi:NTE family protein
MITNVVFNDLNDYTRSYVLGKLGFKEGMKVSYAQIKEGINTLNATGNFSKISYQFNEYNSGDELELNIKENNISTFLKFGLHYDGLFKSAALVNITQKKSFFRNDVMSLDMGIGDNFRYNLDYYVDNGFYFSFGFKSSFAQFNKNISNDFNNGAIINQLGINSLNIDYSDWTNTAYIQTIFAEKFLIGAGIELKYLNLFLRLQICQ